ncbi:MAG TPA: hypothetical protein DCW74_11375 [Alteromonas australica]|uniref:Uncharacterized protein n=1 Tax=Alteromonas australica TaxID=589873 RepID=A0A350P4V4_9ALTE|nr:hypothetical protein [Alteromonas australica]|tara:strand:+ start:70 stop:405 length:336 start_codon:yes stop_codon:yes gene_type:complete
MDYSDDNMVPVDAPENKQGHPSGMGSDEKHMVMQQLRHLEHNACKLLKHIAECATPHLEEEWVKKKIILANDYIDSVHDYIMSSHGKEMRGGMGADIMVLIDKKVSQMPKY